MADKKTNGEKILDTLGKFSPEKLDSKIMDSLDKLSEDAAKAPPSTKQQEEGFETFFGFLFAAIFFGFAYFMYVLIFT